MEDQVHQEPLSKADIQHLKSSARTGRWLTIIFGIITVASIWALVHHEAHLIWTLVTGLLLGFFTFISASSVRDDQASLKNGNKTVRSGIITDVHERFLAYQEKGQAYKTSRKFFYHFHQQDHEYGKGFQHKSEREFSRLPNAFLPGDHLHTEHTSCDLQLKENILHSDGVPDDTELTPLGLTRVAHKVHSNLPLIKYEPRTIDPELSMSGDYYYLHTSTHWIQVEESTFLQYPALSIIKVKLESDSIEIGQTPDDLVEVPILSISREDKEVVLPKPLITC
jgi:hypothetical protein